MNEMTRGTQETPERWYKRLTDTVAMSRVAGAPLGLAEFYQNQFAAESPILPRFSRSVTIAPAASSNCLPVG
jgi:hypothetical protein